MFVLDAQPLDAAFLRDQLDARVQDLGSPAGELIEPLLPSDPTLETLALVDRHWSTISAALPAVNARTSSSQPVSQPIRQPISRPVSEPSGTSRSRIA